MPTISNPISALALVLAGPFIGSFLATLAWRLPRGEKLVFARSACPSCGRALGPADLVPILSWVWRQGRCGGCGTAIAPSYPVIELAAFGLAIWAALLFSGWQAWAAAALGWGLLALAAIDLRHYYLPDLLTLPLAALGLGLSWATGWPAAPADSGIGALLGFGIFALIGLVYRRLRHRAGLGLGDAKLMAAAGAWAGWQGLASVVLIGALSGLAVALAGAALAKRLPGAGEKLAFGPYLALGLWLVVLYGPLHFRLL